MKGERCKPGQAKYFIKRDLKRHEKRITESEWKGSNDDTVHQYTHYSPLLTRKELSLHNFPIERLGPMTPLG